MRAYSQEILVPASGLDNDATIDIDRTEDMLLCNDTPLNGRQALSQYNAATSLNGDNLLGGNSEEDSEGTVSEDEAVVEINKVGPPNLTLFRNYLKWSMNFEAKVLPPIREEPISVSLFDSDKRNRIKTGWVCEELYETLAEEKPGSPSREPAKLGNFKP